MNTTQMTKFQSILLQLPQFIVECNADCEMAYDWVCEMIGESFVNNDDMWSEFYDVWEDNAVCY